MLGHTFFHKGVEQTQSADGQKMIFRRQDILPQFGNRNMPIVIDRLVVTCVLTAAVAVTAIDGEDVWRCLRAVTLMQTDKVARIASLNGDALRIAMIDKSGAEHIPEHPDLPIAAATTYTFTFPIELASRKAYDPDDLAMPGELLDYLEFTGVTVGVNGPAVAGGTLTPTYPVRWYVAVEGREVPYSLLSPVDVIDATAFGASTDLNKIVNGRVAAMYLHRPGSSGGQLTPNLTNLSVDELGRIQYFPEDLKQYYARTRGMVTGSNAANPGVQLRNDPVMAGRTVPVVFTGPACKSTGSVSLETIQLRSTQSTAYTDLTAVTRTIRGWSGDTIKTLQKAHGIGRGFRPKTRDKTAREASAWDPADLAYLPHKSMLPHFLGR